MNIFDIVLVTVGLVFFEVICSIDNAIINAQVLNTMSEKGRRWFLFWGILFAVFVVRGMLPWLIVWGAIPEMGFIESFFATFSSDPKVLGAVDSAKPILLVGGGVFLLFLFFHWIFLEDKEAYGLKIEPMFEKKSAWFFAFASIVLLITVWFSLKKNLFMGFSAVIGSTAFFITHGFKESAEASEERLINTNNISDISKIIYLEIIDMTFSIDGVLGAFAFTISVPLILIGNGIGALVLRHLTVRNIEHFNKYIYLKNGAMYSILLLGLIMILEAFRFHMPIWLAPLSTTGTILYFFIKSHIHYKKGAKKC